MKSTTAVIAAGEVKQIRRHLVVDETPRLVVVDISVSSARRVDRRPIEKLEVITVATTGEQAANCSEFLSVGRSVGVLAELLGSLKQGRGVGLASAMYFVGRSSTVVPFRASDAKGLASTLEAEPAQAA